MTRVIHADCRDAMLDLALEGVRVHSVICDPPYRLESIVKRFGDPNCAPAVYGKDGRLARLSKNFRGQTWDGTEIAHDPEVWRGCYRLLRPGGFLLAFSSPMTGHRMACAIEDAGFRMHPLIGWVYSEGFPKGHAIAKAGPAWDGWYHGTQTLNPALEPIYVAQKPFSEKTGAANVTKHQAGALNIDASRVSVPAGSASKGWPHNLCHDGSEAATALFSGRAETFHSFPPAIYHRKANKDDRIGSHPTQKPIGLKRHLIRLTTVKGGTIFDPFGGSGTTAEAALAEGCNAIIIEKELEYVRDIRRRMARAMV